ncbi:ATP-binding protein [Streptomyces roseolilacinus]|uniref:ATP-binding protein n=2 Tax=Streptomyces roseolilacinus TaxID=66904 RepID=A0A918EPW7_9ACTN|nr:ATP-binding protein [Streptomyces roseolilacinus]
MSQRSGAYATTAGVPPPPALPARTTAVPVLRDLRDRAGRVPRELAFAEADVVVVSGLPGSGKSTLIRRIAPDRAVDSQDTRERWEGRVPRLLPYALYRPLVRAAHYAGLRARLRAGRGVVVHDCGTQSWVRRWLAREARRRGGTLRLLLLDVDPDTAREGQRERGRGVSAYAFARHRRAVGRLVRDAERGVLPGGCGSAVLLDRAAATALVRIRFH